jgi:hypothetical protein
MEHLQQTINDTHTVGKKVKRVLGKFREKGIEAIDLSTDSYISLVLPGRGDGRADQTRLDWVARRYFRVKLGELWAWTHTLSKLGRKYQVAI